MSSPFAQTAGDDCCEACFNRKCKDSKDILPELVQQGITYTPLCFSSFGRVHSEAIRWLEYSSRAGARRRGVADYRPILTRCRRNIGIAIQRRLVDQVRACLPNRENAMDVIFNELDNVAYD